ncbi:hypothetical protein, partial [Xanthomonas hyacinthi]|uniref:hypothetical protein n=1 Tax=Xanthomonas hyacinthi TaxID=56455 RepID=UPI001B80CD53
NSKPEGLSPNRAAHHNGFFVAVNTLLRRLRRPFRVADALPQGAASGEEKYGCKPAAWEGGMKDFFTPPSRARLRREPLAMSRRRGSQHPFGLHACR